MGKDDDESDIPLETGARTEIEGDEISADELLGRPSTMRLVDEVATLTARDFRRDRSDIKEHLLFELRNIQHIRNLSPFLHRVAKNYCLNEKRHDGYVTQHNEQRVAESVHYKRARPAKRAEGADRAEGAIVVPFSPVKTPEQLLELREQLLEVQRRLRAAMANLPEKTRTLACHWAQGLPVKGIMKETGWSSATVYRELSAFHKLLVAQIGPVGELDEDDIDELRAWLADSLRPKVA